VTSSASGMLTSSTSICNCSHDYSGKITSISVTPTSDSPDSTKSATVTFEKETYVYPLLPNRLSTPLEPPN